MSVTSKQFNGPDLTVPDLRVGEVRALRTFSLSLDGALNPVGYLAAGPWVDGANAAQCRHGHTPAAPGCQCGFWAYGTRHAARQNPQARLLLAVVACWGRVVPGTRGLRAQYARIEAIWLSDALPKDRVEAMLGRYPCVIVYGSPHDMLRHHPLTRLDSYQQAWRAVAQDFRPGARFPVVLSNRYPLRNGTPPAGRQVALTVAILVLCWGLMLLMLATLAAHLFWPGAFRA